MRTAKLINGYKSEILKLQNLQFVTLTIRSVPWFALDNTINRMNTAIRAIKKQLTNKRIHTNGVRKLEITFNDVTGLYHPHFHFMLSGRANADMLILYWLLAFPNEARRDAQDVRAFNGNEHNLIELFKYSTKMLASSTKEVTYQGRKSKIKTIGKTPAYALDRIFRALYCRRTFQAMGIIKQVNEDIEELQSQEYEELEYTHEKKYWKWAIEWNETDWLDVMNGELLTGYTPTESLVQILNTS